MKRLTRTERAAGAILLILGTALLVASYIGLAATLAKP